MPAPPVATTNWVPVGPSYLPAASSVANIGARVYLSTNLSISNGAVSPVSFDTRRFDTSGFWSAGNNSRLTCQVAGKYQVSATFEWDPNVTGERAAWLRINGTATIAASRILPDTVAGAPTAQVLSVPWDFQVGDYVELTVYQTSGAGLNVRATPNHSPELAMVLVGGAPGPPGPAGPGTASYGTTLPASPYDGQEAVLVDSTTNPSYQWRFRYNASSSSTYKWEFVGGAAYTTNLLAFTPTADGAWHAGSASPSLRAGQFYAVSTLSLNIGGANSQCYAGVAITGAAQSATGQLTIYAGNWGTTGGIGYVLTATAGQTISSYYISSAAASGANANLSLFVVPNRVS